MHPLLTLIQGISNLLQRSLTIGVFVRCNDLSGHPLDTYGFELFLISQFSLVKLNLARLWDAYPGSSLYFLLIFTLMFCCFLEIPVKRFWSYRDQGYLLLISKIRPPSRCHRPCCIREPMQDLLSQFRRWLESSSVSGYFYSD